MIDQLLVERELNELVAVTLRLECELDLAVNNTGNYE